MYKLYCRLYQLIFRIASYVLPWRKPTLITGKNCLSRLPEVIKGLGLSKILIVTDKVILTLGIMDSMLGLLDEYNIRYTVFDQTVPNPTIDNIEQALKMYHEHHCNAIIAFGGGSPMDCAKGVGARVARPNKSIPNMKGQLKVRKKIPTLFAIPTTAGTGSEATLAAVITNSTTHEKYALNDMALIPHYAVLDPMLTVKLPPNITAATGMDALVHAVEAYIRKSNTKETRSCSLKAVKLIFENLYEAYSNGDNIEARSNMQQAAHFAGIAFTRAYVGYIHAIAHTLGGFYSTPHGLANAIIMPYVLEYYGECIYKPLAELADATNISDPAKTAAENANIFINAVKNMNQHMNIPDKIHGIIDSDIPLMADRALKEANPLYPVPRILKKEDLLKIYNMIK